MKTVPDAAATIPTSEPDMTCETGVYCIRNVANGKRYVGGAYKSFAKRWAEHRRDLRNGTHKNIHLQRAWVKDGEEQFTFEVVERCPSADVEACEQKWLDWLWAQGPAARYNLCSRAESVFGYRFTPQQCAKRSAGQKGRKMLPHVKEALRRSRIGSKHSEETKAHWSEVRKGKRHPPEIVARIADANRGRKRSPEFCERMRQGAVEREAKLRGKPKHTAESRAEIGAASKAAWEVWTEEQKAARAAKISASLTGKKLSEEHRQSLRDGWARRRERLRMEREAIAQAERLQPCES